MDFLKIIYTSIKKLKFIKSGAVPLYTKNDTVKLVKSTRGKGFFAVMNGVLGGLHEIDRGHLDHIFFHFTDGLYADKKGDNWLLYYFNFKNLPETVASNQNLKVFDDIPVNFHLLTRKTDRHENFRIFHKYLVIHSDILDEVDHICRNFDQVYTIGIHYRGTDKFSEAEPATYEQVLEHVRMEVGSLGGLDFQIFIATDDALFLEFMRQQYSERIKCLEFAERSFNNKPVHIHQMRQKLPSQLGREALIDALVLSRTNLLIRTSSNLSLWSTFLNPDLKVVLVNHRFGSTTE